MPDAFLLLSVAALAGVLVLTRCGLYLTRYAPNVHSSDLMIHFAFVKAVKRLGWHRAYREVIGQKPLLFHWLVAKLVPEARLISWQRFFGPLLDGLHLLLFAVLLQDVLGAAAGRGGAALLGTVASCARPGLVVLQ